MKLSTKGRYGLMAMHQLAMEDGAGPLPLKVIAQREQLSEAYLEQLFAQLRKSGLIKSVRGAQGGYVLAKKPEEMTIGEILRALEGDMSLHQCCGPGNEVECDRSDECATKDVLTLLQSRIDAVIDSVTLADMVNGRL